MSSCIRVQASFMSRKDKDGWLHSITAVKHDGTVLCDSFTSPDPLSLAAQMCHWGVVYKLDTESQLGQLFNTPLT